MKNNIECGHNYFLQDTENHTMKVQHDDGVYRHLTFSNNGSSVYRFDIVTYPGFLVYSGDMGCYVFSRLYDMFEFFRDDKKRGKPNFHYWREKLEAGMEESKEYSGQEFIDWIKESIKNYVEYQFDDHGEEFMQKIRDEIWESFGEQHSTETYSYEGYEALENIRSVGYEFQYRPAGADRIFQLDLSEAPDFKDYTIRFVWACYAIQHALVEYDKYKEKEIKWVGMH